MTWQLMVANGKEAGRILVVNRECFWIGRHPECQLRPASPLVSRYHCALQVRSRRLYLVPCEVTAPPFVNGEPAEGETELFVGDRLALGLLTFVVNWDPLPSAVRMAPPRDDGLAELLPVDDSPTAADRSTAFGGGKPGRVRECQRTVTEEASVSESEHGSPARPGPNGSAPAQGLLQS